MGVYDIDYPSNCIKRSVAPSCGMGRHVQMNLELVWLICPIVGILSQLGGTFNKLYRRLGVPTVITLSALLFLGWSWWLPVLFLSIFGVTTLPFTLCNNWFQWVWIWIAGYLLGLPCVFISGWNGLIYALVPCLAQGICGSLSNIPVTAKYFTWKFCEYIIWAMMAYSYAISIQLR